MNITLRKACENDRKTVGDLYKAAIGSPGCVWNDAYPSNADIEDDFSHRCLYVAVKEDAVIGAVSVVPENELDDLPVFRQKKQNAREIARVTIAPSMRGKGYASEMLSKLFSRLTADGTDAVRLLVAKENPCAIALYRRLGFTFLGETAMYGHDYFVCEKLL